MGKFSYTGPPAGKGARHTGTRPASTTTGQPGRHARPRGPKQADLHRDGRYSLHSFPCEDNEDAFYCTGRAQATDDPATQQALAEPFVTERSAPPGPPPAADDHLFSFGLQRCLLTRTAGHGDPSPQHTIWHQAST